MPDYDYALTLRDGVLEIRAGLRDEAVRRVCYISSSFPTEFLTRIEFTCTVAAFKHRLRNKVLEVIVFKRPDQNLTQSANTTAGRLAEVS
jgi:hypothetical protein